MIFILPDPLLFKMLDLHLQRNDEEFLMKI